MLLSLQLKFVSMLICAASRASAVVPAAVHSCPGCTKKFSTWRSAATHLGSSSTCMAKHREKGKLELRQAKAPRVLVDPQKAVFEKERKHVVANGLADLRENGLGDAQMGRIKEKVKGMLHCCEKKLVRRLKDVSRSSVGPSLESTVREVLDVFNGLETHNKEFNYLRQGCQYIEPVEHVFGRTLSHTTDAEGFTYSKKTVTHKGYYMPMTRVLERLFQEDPRAWEMVLLSQNKWFAKPPAKGASQKIYFDVDDGDLFDEHPELGACQRGKAANGKIRLCIILYYDGLEVADARLLPAFELRLAPVCRL